MTIMSAGIVRDTLRNGGNIEQFNYPLIYAYQAVDNPKTVYAFFASPEYDDMSLSPFVKSYTCLMANGILTIAGQKFLNGEQTF